MSVEDPHWDAVEEGVEILRDGDAASAIPVLLRVAEETPRNEYAWHYLGAAYFQTQEWQRSLKAYLTALELSPTYLGATIGAGHTLRMMGELDRALRMGKQALLQRKEDQDALYLMGLAHYQRGDKAAALDYFERFLLSRPEAEVRMEVQGLLQVLRGEVLPLEADDQDD